MKLLAVSGLLSIVCLTGCASLPPSPVAVDAEYLAADGTEYDGKATVYVLRDSTGSGAAYAVEVALDKSSQGSIRRETFVKFGATTGHHDIYATWPLITGEPSVAINADLIAGKTYYFLFSTSFGHSGTMMIAGAKLGPISVDNAKQRLLTYEARK
jgi:hypothetical protein